MPTAKKTATKTKASKSATKKKTTAKSVNSVKAETPVMMNVCRSCHALPAGSVELVSLLLVLVFSLSAVLVTSVYALNRQSAELATLQAQTTVQE